MLFASLIFPLEGVWKIKNGEDDRLHEVLVKQRILDQG
jgi:hypothetical protein